MCLPVPEASSAVITVLYCQCFLSLLLLFNSYPVPLPWRIELTKCCFMWRFVPGFTLSSREFPVGHCGKISLGGAQTSKALLVLTRVLSLSSAKFDIFYVVLQRDVALQLFFCLCT